MTPPYPTSPSDLVPVDRAPLIGHVVSFDEARGLGMVECGPGRTVPFHCSVITDGSRTIDVGAVVAVRVVAGRLGSLEARSVRPLPGVVSPGGFLAAGEQAAHGSGAERPPSSPGSESWPVPGSGTGSSEPSSAEVAGGVPDPWSVPSS